jgi:glucose-6-phosphate isomerase
VHQGLSVYGNKGSTDQHAYHQPGVEAGKKAAAAVLTLQAKVLAALTTTPQTAEQVAATLGNTDAVEAVFLLLEHLAANGRVHASGAGDPGTAQFVSAELNRWREESR